MYTGRSQKTLGPLRGQEFRQANLIQMEINKVNQGSESVYMESEASMKKINKKQLEIGRSLYKSQTYKEIYKKGSFKDVESPIEESVNQLLKVNSFQEDKVKSQRYNKLGIQFYFIMFTQKLIYYLKQLQKQQKLIGKHAHIIKDNGSDYNNLDYLEKTIWKRFKIFDIESFERFMLNILFSVVLIVYSLLIPLILIDAIPIYISLLFVILYAIFKIIDFQNITILDLIILITNSLLYYDSRIVIFNLLLILRINTIVNQMNIFTYSNMYRLLYSVIYVFIYCNFMALFWKYDFDEISYLKLFTNQINLIFSFDYQISQETELHMIIDSLNRIFSLILLLNFSLNVFNYLKQSKSTRKQIELYERLIKQKSPHNHSIKIQHSLRSIMMSKAKQNYNQKSEEILNQIDQNLPMELQKTMNFNSYLQVLQKSQFISKQFSKDFQKALSEQMKEQYFEEGEIIQQQNSQMNHLYFLLEGSLSVQMCDRMIGQIESQQVISEFEFFACIVSPCQFITQKKCKVAYLDFQQFYDSIYLNYKDFQIYKMWLDRFCSKPTIRGQFKICYICKATDHLTITCPAVFHQANYLKVVSNSTYSSLNPREDFHRPEKRRFNSLINQNLISITAITLAQQQELIARNTSMMDQYMGKYGNEEYQLFADDDQVSKYQRSQTYTHQQSIMSPKTNKTGMTGRERVPTVDSNINRTLTIRTLKASEHETNRIKPSLNDSIVVSSSPQQKPPNLMIFPRDRNVDLKRTSLAGSSIIIERERDKKSSLQSQQPVNSTSILASKEIIQQLQSNLGSPNIHNSSKNKEQSINVWIRSDTQPIVCTNVDQCSELLFGSQGQLILIKEFDVMKNYEYYNPNYNVQNVIDRFEIFVAERFTRR